ncbi:carbohydrate esterase family 16 protein [Hebeloma cylindrosporum]|uniref:Carbohydrate esterase family 16 protein n=1 Tax=Hebeloma cylindrosporum TaxID=76867 RepID=A0A0C2Y118_HEBCY|nr:carbohydrate esterase family 16 protein [Hebeloma cylindrosporum h7]
MSTIYQVGSHWRGFSALRRFVIFGDSYSSVGFIDYTSLPSASQPLGVSFPGRTYNEKGLPNWVGHVITKYAPEPRFNPYLKEMEQDVRYLESPLLVYDYAEGGSTMEDVKEQIQDLFLPNIGKTEGNWDDVSLINGTLFITWAGINDCAYGIDPDDAITGLLVELEKLIDISARNFLFVDVPPLHRIPAWPDNRERSPSEGQRYFDWNAALRRGIQTFSRDHKDITALLFSSFETFERIFDHPEEHEIWPEEKKKRVGQIWMDGLHPTSAIHDIIASRMADFLSGVTPCET